MALGKSKGAELETRPLTCHIQDTGQPATATYTPSAAPSGTYVENTRKGHVPPPQRLRALSARSTRPKTVSILPRSDDDRAARRLLSSSGRARARSCRLDSAEVEAMWDPR